VNDSDRTERDHEMYRDSGFLRELADKVRNHNFVGGTGSYLRHHVLDKLCTHFGLVSENSSDHAAEINRRRGEMAVAREALDEAGVPKLDDGITLTMSQRINALRKKAHDMERQLLDAETAGYRVAMESICILNAITSHTPRTCGESVLYCPQLGKHLIDSTATLIRAYLNGSEGKEFTKLSDQRDMMRALLRKHMQIFWQLGRLNEADECADAIGEPRPSDHERGDA